ncbi:MAG: sodium/solute symporter [Pirellulales bacterium]|nr:sodium/solute symporter [Pirellulales bacterium]
MAVPLAARSMVVRQRQYRPVGIVLLLILAALLSFLPSAGLADDDADARAADALTTARPGEIPGMVLVDWLVIGLYMLGVLAVGWYYSRRAKSTDDYLLGGRNMRPLGVGLSLFATLFSTITYLMWPGEIILNGPMILAMIAGYPLVYLLVGWLIIPFIMSLRVTSAYEILETRLGLGVRMLGSTFFLLMRLLWMAVILFATVQTILIPLSGLPQQAAPYLCAALAIITIIYTSMGGLRAVVVTDVAQTVILFGGAILTVALVSYKMGGVGQWFPRQWPAQWPQADWSLGLTARVTFLGAMLGHFTWWVCSAGSDQMAIQRYLATRDVKAARRVLLVSLLANVAVALVLAAVGMSLFGYYRAHPELIPQGQSLLKDADKLFPRFIASGMPAGVSGAIVAGLLAAAMSSLSSGVNSSCSVITVDFIDRFRGRRASEADHVRLARYIAILVGVAVVVLSAGVGAVRGNLLEVAFKVVNLLTAPLFGLFFMAIFVRRATPLGTVAGAVLGTETVAVINYWRELAPGAASLMISTFGHCPEFLKGPGISFLWAMPFGLVVQIAVGVFVSLIAPRRSGSA